MFISVEDGYVAAFGAAGDNCTEEEYAAVQEAMTRRPAPESGYDYRLRFLDLQWERYDLPVEDVINEEEALEILLGGRDYALS